VLGSSDAGVVYRRPPVPKGPMQGMGYDYLRERLTAAKLPMPELMDATEVYESPSYEYEALNFVDGQRTVCGIRDDLAAVISPIESRQVAEFFRTLETLKLVERTRAQARSRDSRSSAP
jgi:hypothetical protein